MRSNPSLSAGTLLVAALLAAAVLAPVLAPHDPFATDPSARLLPPGAGHPLGTDALGRDVLSRLLYGARLTLGAALIVSAASLALGTAVGVAAGYAGGRVDNLLMRLVDLWKAFPGRILALVLAGVLGPGTFNLCLALVLTSWVACARVVRGLTLAAREREYVQAARACGRSVPGIVRRHVLPDLAPQLAVVAALDAGRTLMALSGLSLLGLGAQPPTPEWGVMINDGRTYFRSHPHLLFCPGLALMLAVAGLTLLGEGIRDACDPRRPATRGGRRPGGRRHLAGTDAPPGTLPGGWGSAGGRGTPAAGPRGWAPRPAAPLAAVRPGRAWPPGAPPCTDAPGDGTAPPWAPPRRSAPGT